MFSTLSYHFISSDVLIHSICCSGCDWRAVQYCRGGAGFAEWASLPSCADLDNTIQSIVNECFIIGIFKIALKSSLLMWVFFSLRDTSYLSDDSMWVMCTAPNNIVPFHIGLFATLLAVSCLEVILCGIQMINGLFGCLCGTCTEKGVCWSKLRVHYVRVTLIRKKRFELLLFPASVNSDSTLTPPG